MFDHVKLSTSLLAKVSLSFLIAWMTPDASAKHPFLYRSKAENRQNILAASQAAERVYKIHEDFTQTPSNYLPSPQNEDFYTFSGYDSYRLGQIPYKLDGVFCGRKVLNSKECGLFLTFFKALHPKAPSIVSVKGTTSAEDWKHNLLNQGTFYIEWLVNILEASTFTNYQEDQHLQSAIDYVSAFMGEHVLMTGHSLGGGLAQALALTVTKEFHQNQESAPQIDLITFNSLAGESLIDKLHADLKGTLTAPARILFKIQEKENFSFQKNQLPDNIASLSISTEDDILQGVNKFLRKKNLGAQFTLPSRRPVHKEGSLHFPGDAFTGHRGSSIAADLQFCYSSEAQSFLTKQLMAESTEEGLNRRKKQAMEHYRRWGAFDDNSPEKTGPSSTEREAYFLAHRYPQERAALYRRMLRFLKNEEVRQVMGIE